MYQSLIKSLTSKLNQKSTDENSLTFAEEQSLSDIEIITQLPNVLCVKDWSGHWLEASEEFLEAIGLKNYPFEGKTDNDFLKLSNVNSELLTLNHKVELQVKSTGVAAKEAMFLGKDAEQLDEIELMAVPLKVPSKGINHIVICGKFSKQSAKLLDKLYLLDSMFNYSHLSFIILDHELNILNVNNAFTDLTHLSFDDVYGKNLSLINIGKNRNLSEQILLNFKDQDFDLWVGEIICPNVDTGAILAKLEITRILNEQNVTTNYFATLIDITSQKKNEKRIRQIAHYDSLTNLSNRVLFMDRITQALSECRRHNKILVVFFIDLDKFKEVNDSYGHDVGDAVLKEAAQRFLSVTRKEDVVSRFSGDEFAILFLCDRSLGQVLYESSIIAKKIIHRISKPFNINNREIFIGSSIGISIYPEHGDSVETLLKKSDIAMYEAKNRGRNNFQFYKDEFSIATNNRLDIEQKLRSVIEKDELKLFFQPQFTINDNKIWGAEVLIRWFENKAGIKKIISPEQFIPIAEDTGLIVEIGQWILKRSCRQLRYWMDEGLPIKQVSVNVSARQFMDAGFVNSVAEAINESKIKPENLELEITESMLVGDVKRIELQLKRIKSMGVKIALDDFGTGYSSLSYLKNFPIDVLKIDQSFIKEIAVDSKDAKIASAIIEMGHSLDQKIIAEGVENEDQLMLLIQRKCDVVQGYFYSKPLSIDEMTDFLKSEQSKNIFL